MPTIELVLPTPRDCLRPRGDGGRESFWRRYRLLPQIKTVAHPPCGGPTGIARVAMSRTATASASPRVPRASSVMPGVRGPYLSIAESASWRVLQAEPGHGGRQPLQCRAVRRHGAAPGGAGGAGGHRGAGRRAARPYGGLLHRGPPDRAGAERAAGRAGGPAAGGPQRRPVPAAHAAPRARYCCSGCGFSAHHGRRPLHQGAQHGLRGPAAVAPPRPSGRSRARR